jgi:hypothetical protein
VYRIDERANRFHLRKLATRMPGTISEIEVERDGGLNYIRQDPAGSSLTGSRTGSGLLAGLQSPETPVDRLMAYVNEQEAGNWLGTSRLRALDRHWIRNDRLLRVDAITGERNGSGVPMASAPPGVSGRQTKELDALATSYRAGEAAGGVMPNGADLRFRGVEGTLPDIIEKIRYDEQIAARFLGMFTKLGTTKTGSRALGQTFVDFFTFGSGGCRQALRRCDQRARHRRPHRRELRDRRSAPLGRAPPSLLTQTRKAPPHSPASSFAARSSGLAGTIPQAPQSRAAIGRMSDTPLTAAPCASYKRVLQYSFPPDAQ